MAKLISNKSLTLGENILFSQNVFVKTSKLCHESYRFGWIERKTSMVCLLLVDILGGSTALCSATCMLQSLFIWFHFCVSTFVFQFSYSYFWATSQHSQHISDPLWPRTSLYIFFGPCFLELMLKYSLLLTINMYFLWSHYDVWYLFEVKLWRVWWWLSWNMLGFL